MSFSTCRKLVERMAGTQTPRNDDQHAREVAGSKHAFVECIKQRPMPKKERDNMDDQQRCFFEGRTHNRPAAWVQWVEIAHS